MKGTHQWDVEVRVNARSDEVWDVANDVSLIPQFHPDVDSVDLLDGQSDRTVGSRYQCNVEHGKGKGSCIEEVVECVPGSKISTYMASDSWGVDKMLKDFVVETTLIPQPDNTTVLRLEGFYDPIGWVNRILNLVILRRKTKQRSLDVMDGIKRLAEERATPKER